MAAPLQTPAGFVPLNDGYSREERDVIAAQLQAGGTVTCPRCQANVSVSTVQAPPGVAYVRRRVLVVCPNCHRSVALDRER